MHMLKQSILALFLLGTLLINGCGRSDWEDVLRSENNDNLIYEETISPNEDYVFFPSDIIYETIQVYQDEDDKVTVMADSNNSFFEAIEYEVAADVPLSKDDIEITWTTFMGDSTASKDDQLIVAHVKISCDGELLDERAINFVSKAFDQLSDIADGLGKAE